MNSEVVAGSFRDPSGFLFVRDKILYRQINQAGRADYDGLLNSGLYAKLQEKGWLIPHQEVLLGSAVPESAYKIIQPERVPFISFPYEWSFSQLKDAALTTLAIQRLALEFNMSLKDSSAYNIQFVRGKPLLIDTLSFEVYHEGEPWTAYRQFCQHFLAPLALMAYRDVRLNQLLRVYIDGVPLDLASALLPWSTRFSLPLLFHLHLHASSQRRYAHKSLDKTAETRKVTRIGLLGTLDNLQTAINSLKWKPTGTAWGDYYDEMTHYTTATLEHKRQLVAAFIARAQPLSVWDLGANTGVFSRIAAAQGINTVAFDIDPAAVEKNYLTCKAERETQLLPLVMDLTNPSPALGWQHQERPSLLERGPAAAVLALALIHHLAIANNVPLPRLAEFFRAAGDWLITEFVPKSDSQVQILLATREDIFPNYTREGFEQAFAVYFTIQAAEPIQGSERWLYLMSAKK